MSSSSPTMWTFDQRCLSRSNTKPSSFHRPTNLSVVLTVKGRHGFLSWTIFNATWRLNCEIFLHESSPSSPMSTTWSYPIPWMLVHCFPRGSLAVLVFRGASNIPEDTQSAFPESGGELVYLWSRSCSCGTCSVPSYPMTCHVLGQVFRFLVFYLQPFSIK